MLIGACRSCRLWIWTVAGIVLVAKCTNTIITSSNCQRCGQSTHEVGSVEGKDSIEVSADIDGFQCQVVCTVDPPLTDDLLDEIFSEKVEKRKIPVASCRPKDWEVNKAQEDKEFPCSPITTEEEVWKKAADKQPDVEDPSPQDWQGAFEVRWCEWMDLAKAACGFQDFSIAKRAREILQRVGATETPKFIQLAMNAAVKQRRLVQKRMRAAKQGNYSRKEEEKDEFLDQATNAFKKEQASCQERRIQFDVQGPLKSHSLCCSSTAGAPATQGEATTPRAKFTVTVLKDRPDMEETAEGKPKISDNALFAVSCLFLLSIGLCARFRGTSDDPDITDTTASLRQPSDRRSPVPCRSAFLFGGDRLIGCLSDSDDATGTREGRGAAVDIEFAILHARMRQSSGSGSQPQTKLLSAHSLENEVSKEPSQSKVPSASRDGDVTKDPSRSKALKADLTKDSASRAKAAASRQRSDAVAAPHRSPREARKTKAKSVV